MQNTAKALIGYGIFLILAGLTGYLSNPEKAKTALMSGGSFGLLNIVFGLLVQRGLHKVVTVGLVVATLLAGVFTWRSIVTWQAVAGGASEKTFAAVLISSMLLASILIAVYLFRSLRRG